MNREAYCKKLLSEWLMEPEFEEIDPALTFQLLWGDWSGYIIDAAISRMWVGGSLAYYFVSAAPRYGVAVLRDLGDGEVLRIGNPPLFCSQSLGWDPEGENEDPAFDLTSPMTMLRWRSMDAWFASEGVMSDFSSRVMSSAMALSRYLMLDVVADDGNVLIKMLFDLSAKVILHYERMYSRGDSLRMWIDEYKAYDKSGRVMSEMSII